MHFFLKNHYEVFLFHGFKYDDTKTIEKRFINNKDLDEVSPRTSKNCIFNLN